MNDLPDSTPPPAATVSPTFRRTFTWRFYNPAHVEALEGVGELLWEFLNETHQFGPPGVEDRPLTNCELEAVMGELEGVASYMEDLATDRFGTALTKAEDRLARQAGKFAKQVRRVMASIEGAIA